MVQNDSSNSSDESFIPMPASVKGIPIGKYKLVGWGIDTTGRRLIDEICQIAGYSPKCQFSQYIMPFADMSPFFSRKHSIRVINTDRYRMLKDMRSNKFVKTKSDITALTEFIEWLEKLQTEAEAADGIILIFYEIGKSFPGMLLEVIRKFNLLERFSKVVKGFANCFHIAQSKCGKTTKSFDLKVMSKVLLNKDGEDFSSAVDRARVAYQIAAHLVQGERENVDEKESPNVEPELIEFVCPFVSSIADEEEEVAKFKIVLERQNTFRPVFGAFLRANKHERQHATRLRKLLVENNINCDQLKEIYESGGNEGLEKVLKTEIADAEEQDFKDLFEILDCFFDPDKKAVQPKLPPKPRYYNHNNNGRRQRFNNRKSFSKDKNTDSSNSANVSSDNQNDQIKLEKEETETTATTVEVQ